MEFRVLGSLAAVANGVEAQLGAPKQRALLAVLLMHVGEIVPVDRLIELLWGEGAPRTAPHSIQIYISELRRALEPVGGAELIATRPPGYVLETDRESVDAWQFEQLVHDGARMLESGDSERGRAALRRAMDLWHGPALSDFAYEEFAQPYVRRLNEIHLDAIEALAAAELEAGRIADAVGLLTMAVREDPLRERSRELLMLALYRSGRHADALRTFAQLQGQLAEELGIDPSPQIRALYDQILLHDPALVPETALTGATVVRNPYKGLRAFKEEDAADFFGRGQLVGQLVHLLADGARLVSLVGPSGSGKSSAVAAGLFPQLRAGVIPGSEHWRIDSIVPDARMPGQVEALIESGSDLIVIDQFEQLFSTAEPEARDAFLTTLADAVTSQDGSLRVVLTLRADYYDRPLLHARFAAVFGPSVINVVPMTADELEAAVVEPARRVGVDIDGALLAELVADTADRSGTLPLLQLALTELFERRSGKAVTRASFADLGGLRGLLSRKAEGLFLGLQPTARSAVMQVFLRLIRVGSGARESRRQASLRELSDLGIDPVALSEILTTFGQSRLMTFDRDSTTGVATVEVAHEALIEQWDRLAGWVERHRTALRRHGALAAAAEEWEASGRKPEYLLTGSRLGEFESWRTGETIQLTGRELAFLDAGIELRRSAEAAEAERIQTEHRLERRARTRLVGLAVVVALLAAVVTYGALVGIGTGATRVTLTAAGPSSFYQMVGSGFDRGVSDFGLVAQKVLAADMEDPETEWPATMMQVADAEPALIVFMDLLAEDVDPFAREYPNVHFALVDQVGGEPNVAYLSFADQEGAYLAGVAAALKSDAGTIGFIGGTEFEVIWEFQAGYEAGARAADPGVRILTTYLAGYGDLNGFIAPDAAEAAARSMFSRGADVVFHAAGDSGTGLFHAAASVSEETGRQLWAIGVDTDQYETVMSLPGALGTASWQPHILTSVVKRVDQAMYLALEDVAHGRFTPGPREYGLASGLLDLSYSGGFIDDIRPDIERFKNLVVTGAVTVPCIPNSRLDLAREHGISPEVCKLR